MKRFVVPPSWPTPPRRSWVPPKTWQPDPAWPPAPEGWKFWADGKGNPVRGPIGRYGGPSRRVAFAGAGGLVLFLAVNIWALTAIGLFDGNGRDTQAVPIVDDSPTPSATVTPTAPKTTAKPSVPPPVPKTTKPTVTPTVKPSKTRTTRKPEQVEEREPVPTKTATKTIKPRPTPTTPRPPTREEILQEYCRQQGWDPEWCDPDNWPEDPEQGPPPGRR